MVILFYLHKTVGVIHGREHVAGTEAPLLEKFWAIHVLE